MSFRFFQRTFFVLLISLWAVLGNAQGEKDLARANQFMIDKQYQEAARIYESLLAEGYTGADLYFNLGNAWYRAGDKGRAILNYERALRLQPRDAATRANLAIVKAELTDEIIELEPFFLYRWWKGLLSILSSTLWAIIGLVLLWGALFYGFRYLYGKERAQRKTGFIYGISLTVVGLFVLFISFQQYQMENNSRAAIILAEEAPLCSAPNDPNTAFTTLHAGTKVFLLDKIGAWRLVRLANGDRGWVNEEELEKI